MKDPIFKEEGFIDHSGKLSLPPSLLRKAGAAFSGIPVMITIEKKREQRSEDQNSYYWVAIVNPICDALNDLGERLMPDTVHELLKYKFLRVSKMASSGGVILDYVKSTRLLKTHEFAFYLEDCIRFAAEDLDLKIDPPDRSKSKYSFPEFPRMKESRATYLKRIGQYLEVIFSKGDLLRYFNQNQDWSSDAEIKGLFRKRADALKV